MERRSQHLILNRLNLPGTPIRESDLRKGKFESINGVGATELDALEALRPGEMIKIIKREVEPYIDEDLEERYAEKMEEAHGELNEELYDEVREEIGEVEEIREGLGEFLDDKYKKLEEITEKSNRRKQERN